LTTKEIKYRFPYLAHVAAAKRIDQMMFSITDIRVAHTVIKNKHNMNLVQVIQNIETPSNWKEMQIKREM